MSHLNLLVGTHTARFFILLLAALQSVFSNEADSSVEIASVEEFTKYFTSITIASKTQEIIFDAPGVISVITQEDIQKYGGITLAEVIERAPGLQFIGSHLFPNNTMVVRGDLQSHFDNHILILINGRPFRDDISGGQNATIYECFPIDMVEHIEFIRGPGSVLYGTNAFDGVINIVTKKPSGEKEADITVGTGSFGAKIGNIMGGLKKEDRAVMAAVNYFHDNGWDFRATTSYPPAFQDSTGSMKYYKHRQSGAFSFFDKGFSFNAFQASMKRGILGQTPAWQLAGDGYSWIEDERIFLDAGYSKRLREKYTLNSNITFNYCAFESHLSQMWSAENSYSAVGEVSLGGPVVNRMNFIIGSAAIRRWSERLAGARIPEDNAFYYYAYTQIDYAPIKQIKLFTGAQFNKTPNIDGVFVPRIGAIAHATDYLGAKINYTEAFRSPMPLETKTYFPGVIVGNPLLKPEIVNTADIQVFCALKKLQPALTFFNSRYSDLIGRVAHPTIANTNTYENIGTLEIRGIEAEGALSLTSSISLEASATYQKEVDDKSLMPKYLAKGGISYSAPFGLNVGVFNKYYGSPKPNTAGKAVNPEAKEVHLVSINATYSAPFNKDIKVSIFIQNALGQDYYFPEFDKKLVNTLPLTPGRVLYGTVSYSF